MAPIVPGFTTQASRLEATIRAIADHDAAFVGANVLHLKGGTKDHFMGFLRQEYPHLVEGYERLYPGAYAPKSYTTAVKTMVHALEERYDIRWRASESEPVEGSTEQAPPTQVEFDWKPSPLI